MSTPALHGVSPHLVCDDAAAAIEFYQTAFGAREVARMPGPDGRLMHARVEIEGATVMLVDANPAWGATSPKTLGGTPVTLHITTPDVDGLAARAVAAGARVIMPVADAFWGDRYGVFEDPFGHRWSMATPLRAMTTEEISAAARAFFAQAALDAAERPL